MKTIAIDGSEANELYKVGSSQYAYNLLTTLYRMNLKRDSDLKFIIFLKQSKNNGLPDENQFWKYQILPTTNLWMLKRLVPKLLSVNNIDLFFSPTHYLPVFTLIPQVCTIHDLGYLMFSEQFKRYDFWQLKYWTAISIFISKYIISVSNSTRKDIVRHYPFATNKVKTIYHGVDGKIFNKNISNHLVRRIKEKYKIDKNYILSIGTLKPSKNIVGILKAYKELVLESEEVRENYQFVIAGKKGWLYEDIFRLVKDFNLERNVIFTDYVDEIDKPVLYKGSKALISPSFWEGFGIHVLESMSCGTPVVISKEGSLSEIAGNAGVYVDPYNVTEIKNGIKKVVLADNLKYNRLSGLCVSRAKSFTWEKTASETQDLFKQIIEKK